jgi:DnaJ-domain-containing protein 1
VRAQDAADSDGKTDTRRHVVNDDVVKQANKWIKMAEETLTYIKKMVDQLGTTVPQLEIKMDYWEVMGMPRNSTQRELKVQWLELMKIYHPDRCGGHGEMAAKINEAYQEICREKGWKA